MRDVRQGAQGAVLALGAAVEPRVVDGDGHAGGDQAQQGLVVLAVGVEARGFEVDDADELLAHDHGHGHLTAHGVHRVEVARVGAHVARDHQLAGGGGGAGESFAGRERQVADDLLAVADGVANAQVAPLLAVEQDGEQVAVDDAGDDLRHVGKQIVEIKRLLGGGGNLEQEIEQLGTLAKTDSGFARSLHQSLRRALRRRRPRRFSRSRWRRCGWRRLQSSSSGHRRCGYLPRPSLPCPAPPPGA